ncbi:MAG: hypothetical protein WCK91_01460 [bacterium]
MHPVTIFFSVFLITIICIRLFLLKWKIASQNLFPWLKVRGFYVHHYMYGLSMMLVAFLFRGTMFGLVMYAVGLGFIIDEVPAHFIGRQTWDNYYKWRFNDWVIAFVFLVYVLRFYIVYPMV